MKKQPNPKQAAEFVDDEFAERRRQARVEINQLDADAVHDKPERDAFFNVVYDRASNDAAQIPWADLAPKPQLANWLKTNDGTGKTALDIACGLGDNAEEISAAGFDTTAFDLSDSAIEWAKKRFPQSNVHYQTANLFEAPADWQGGFDLVNECYTLQALPPQMLAKTTKAIADLVRPGGVLLIYTRLRPQEVEPDGPPWPLSAEQAMAFGDLGFSIEHDERFELTRGERKIAHQFAQWRKHD